MRSTNTTKDRISDKDFENLKARFALKGHRLYRTDPVDGRVLFFIERLGMIQLADPEHAIDLLTMMESR